MGTWTAERARVRDAITRSGTMATTGGESPTGVFEGMPIEAGDTDMGEAGGGGAANGVTGIASMTRTTPATATAAEPLERNENGKRLRSWGPEAFRAPRDWRSRMENNATAGTEANEAASNCRTPSKPAGRTNSPRRGTVARDDDVDARERAEGRRPPRG